MVKHSKRQGGQRRAINTKVTDDIRTRLEAAAAEHGQTLSAEIEYRLIRSFIDDKMSDFEEEMTKDPSTRELLSTLRAVLGSVYRFTERSWKDDQPSRDAVASAVGAVLQLLFENDPIDLPVEGSEERKILDRQRVVLRSQGRMMALGILAPSLKDKNFQAFVDEAKAQSGYVDPGPDPDYETLRRQLEAVSDPAAD